MAEAKEKKKMTSLEKLSAIQVEFKAAKSKWNGFGKYNYRSAEDILEALKPINDKYKTAFVVTEKMLSVDPPIIESTATMYDSEDPTTGIPATAIVGVDLNQKGMNVPQTFGSASSYGKKYALGNLLAIDDTQDSDATNDHGKSNAAKSTLTPTPAAANAKTKIDSLTSDLFNKAADYIGSGGSMDTIKNKYELSPEVETKLSSLGKLQKGLNE